MAAKASRAPASASAAALRRPPRSSARPSRKRGARGVGPVAQPLEGRERALERRARAARVAAGEQQRAAAARRRRARPGAVDRGRPARSSRASSASAPRSSPAPASASTASGSTGKAPGCAKPIASSSRAASASSRAASAQSPSDSASSPSTPRARTAPGRSCLRPASRSRRAAAARASSARPRHACDERERVEQQPLAVGVLGVAGRPRSPRARAPRPPRSRPRRRPPARGRTTRRVVDLRPAAGASRRTARERAHARSARSPDHSASSACCVRGLVNWMCAPNCGSSATARAIRSGCGRPASASR